MSRDPRGEICILHRILLRPGTTPYVVVACRPGCPRYNPAKR